MGTLDEYKVDHLILLVGGNPLPNYVAARVLAKRGATLHLVYTQKTDAIARRLARCLSLPAEDIRLGGEFAPPQFIPVDERDPRNIFSKISALFEPDKDSGQIAIARNRRVGLNYTSGNRPMSVHAYDAVKKNRDNAIFSYLDASRLEMLVHDAACVTTLPIRADKLLNMRLETLFELQGLTEKLPKPSPTPIQPNLAQTLAQLHSSAEGTQAWFDWGGRKKDNKSADWTKLPKGEPKLEAVEAALTEMCGGSEPSPDAVARALGQETLPSCTKWFQSDWLESYVLSCVQDAIRGRSDTFDALMNVHRVREDQVDVLELDVVVMRTYQLFVFSCIVSDRDDACKYHAMEAYVRARQTGGDEARVGLVCLHPTPANFQKKLLSSLDAAGKIKVFGRGDLTSLTDRIRDWLNNQP